MLTNIIELTIPHPILYVLDSSAVTEWDACLRGISSAMCTARSLKHT